MNAQLEKSFEKACNYVASNTDKFNQSQLLVLYAHYKQANEGPCKSSKPSFLLFKEKQKWQAWKNLGNIPKEQAMQFYIDAVKDVDLDWENNTFEHKVGWVRVSCLADTSNDLVIKDEDKTIFDYVKEENLENIKKLSKLELNNIDENGMTPLLWAADRGYNEIVKFLVNENLDINFQDPDGQTALHYASSCGHIDVVESLLLLGADVKIKDSDGLIPVNCAESQEVKKLFENYKHI